MEPVESLRKYKYTTQTGMGKRRHWTTSLPGMSRKTYKSEKDAAVAVDMFLIKNSLEPINVLKRKDS